MSNSQEIVKTADIRGISHKCFNEDDKLDWLVFSPPKCEAGKPAYIRVYTVDPANKQRGRQPFMLRIMGRCAYDDKYVKGTPSEIRRMFRPSWYVIDANDTDAEKAEKRRKNEVLLNRLVSFETKFKNKLIEHLKKYKIEVDKLEYSGFINYQVVDRKKGNMERKTYEREDPETHEKIQLPSPWRYGTTLPVVKPSTKATKLDIDDTKVECFVDMEGKSRTYADLKPGALIDTVNAIKWVYVMEERYGVKQEIRRMCLVKEAPIKRDKSKDDPNAPKPKVKTVIAPSFSFSTREVDALESVPTPTSSSSTVGTPALGTAASVLGKRAASDMATVAELPDAKRVKTEGASAPNEPESTPVNDSDLVQLS